MRVALIGPSAPFRGGIAQYNDELAGALAGRGHVVERLSYTRLYPRLLFPGRTQYRGADDTLDPSARTPVDGVSVDAPRTGSSCDPRQSPATLPPARVVLDSMSPMTWLRTADTVQADVALCQWWHPFFAPALATVAARLARRSIRTIFVCHNLEPHERFPGAGALSALALRRASGFVATSEHDAARLRAGYPGRPVAVVVPPPTLPPRCAHGDDREACARALHLPPARRRALFFGYVRAYKGLPTLIAALAATPPDLQLVVAGEIYHRDAAFYAELAARAGVADRVVLFDRFIPMCEVSCCFRAADIVVLPYWQASQSAVVPLAMAYGRAVVATAVGGIPEVVTDGATGVLAPPRDVPALAAAITRALDHAPEWGRAAAAAAARYTWDDAAEKIGALAAHVSSATGAC